MNATITEQRRFTKLLLSRLSKEELLRLAHALEKEMLSRRHDIGTVLNVPLDIFNTKLSPAEALVKYLKEDHSLSYKEIGKALQRDERSIWSTYRRASEKMSQRFVISSPKYLIPLSIFSQRQFSILEALMMYLVETLHLRVANVVTLVNKSYSTLYTTYMRAKQKKLTRSDLF